MTTLVSTIILWLGDDYTCFGNNYTFWAQRETIYSSNGKLQLFKTTLQHILLGQMHLYLLPREREMEVERTGKREREREREKQRERDKERER